MGDNADAEAQRPAPSDRQLTYACARITLAGVEEVSYGNVDKEHETPGEGGLGWKCLPVEKVLETADRLWHVKKALDELEELVRKRGDLPPLPR